MRVDLEAASEIEWKMANLRLRFLTNCFCKGGGAARVAEGSGAQVKDVPFTIH
jgi:hypothetical protein